MTLRRMPANEAKRIVAEVDQDAAKPGSLANQVKKLTGSPSSACARRLPDDDGRHGAVPEVLKVGHKAASMSRRESMQKIVTPKGETLVVLTLDEYEGLAGAADVAAAKTVRADIAAGCDELVPAELVKRILAGENPIRAWREHRDMTARDLASKARLSPTYLSEIETGKKDGSVSVVRNIADALDVEIGDLV